MLRKSPKDSTSGDHELHQNVMAIQITNAAKKNYPFHFLFARLLSVTFLLRCVEQDYCKSMTDDLQRIGAEQFDHSKIANSSSLKYKPEISDIGGTCHLKYVCMVSGRHHMYYSVRLSPPHICPFRFCFSIDGPAYWNAVFIPVKIYGKEWQRVKLSVICLCLSLTLCAVLMLCSELPPCCDLNLKLLSLTTFHCRSH